MDIKTRLQRLQERRFDSVAKSLTLSNAATAKTLSDTEKYLIGSMEPVSPQQSDIVLKTGERVKNQLESYLNNAGLYPAFEYQGSVTNNTHIKLNSDIDLIVASELFFSPKDGSYASFSTYAHDPAQTIRTLRAKCKSGLSQGFPAATVIEKARCLGVSGGSLQRDVDVIPCNWIKNRNYEQTNKKIYLGIRVLDVEKNIWIENYPFLHNAHLDYKDSQTNGNLKRIIRLLKTLREDAVTSIDVSSYDICGLAYSFDEASMKSGFYEGPFEFLERFLSFSKALEVDFIKQATLTVPNQTRILFSADGLRVSELKKLNAELGDLLDLVRTKQLRGFFPSQSLNELLKGK